MHQPALLEQHWLKVSGGLCVLRIVICGLRGGKELPLMRTAWKATYMNPFRLSEYNHQQSMAISFPTNYAFALFLGKFVPLCSALSKIMPLNRMLFVLQLHRLYARTGITLLCFRLSAQQYQAEL